MTDDRNAATFRFGRFVLRPGERQLLADGVVVALEPRAFDVLTALVERAGELVTKDDLMERIWPGRVVEEGNLHVHVSALRKAVGHDAIATVVGRGYRFSASTDSFNAGAPRTTAPHNLPQPLTHFIGRESDLAVLSNSLSQRRLISLVGIGGGGKTRLAIELAEMMLDSFPDGVRFVDLASVSEPERVALAVAAVVGVRERADAPVEEMLARHFSDRNALLVLDNCELLVDACAALVERVLAAAPRVRVLVTSRERLGVDGEQVVPVRSLSLPPTSAQTAEELLASEAVQLFCDRARLVVPEFAFDTGNAATIVDICRRLDGIPLAVELAAARVKMLSVEQIRAKLDDRFRLLTGNMSALSRHQTLLATLQSSFDHLAAIEQHWLQRLSIFAGGWTLEAATAIAGNGDDNETLERLGRLVDKSLVLVDRTDPRAHRYNLLETVRHYAQDRLEESGTIDVVRERHLAYFLEFAKTAQQNLFSEAVKHWLAAIDAELPNLLAAHAWCDRAPNGGNRGLDLATNLRTYWLGRGLFAYGQLVYDEALARPGVDPRAMLRGKALYALGQHQYVRGRLSESVAPTEEALSIAREHGDDEWVVFCLDRICLACLWLGDTSRAVTYCDEELAVANRTGKRRLVAFSLTAKGGVFRAQGDFDNAAHAYERALALFDDEQDVHNRYNALVNVARVSVARGDQGRARRALATAIDLAMNMGTTYRGHFALDATSRLAAACGSWEPAASFQGASDAAVDMAGGVRNWFDDSVLAALQGKPRAMLGADGYALAYERGRTLNLATALAEALAWLDAPT
ncbi:MAG: winged helix-turn-helix domain-containing protein [Betaproteobacteria bacterium]